MSMTHFLRQYDEGQKSKVSWWLSWFLLLLHILSMHITFYPRDFSALFIVKVRILDGTEHTTQCIVAVGSGFWWDFNYRRHMACTIYVVIFTYFPQLLKKLYEMVAYFVAITLLGLKGPIFNKKIKSSKILILF